MAILPNNTQNRPSIQAGSGFTNLQRVLQANKSNQLGNTVSTGVQKAGENARGAINQAGQQFQTQLDSEKQRLGQVGQRVDHVLGDIPNASDDDVKAFEGIRAGEYRGPTGVANANELRSKAQEAQSLGNAGGSEAGRFGLLQRFVGRGNNSYNLGSQRLDNMLLGQQGNQQLKAARASTMGLGNTADKQIGSAAARGQEGQGMARQIGDQTINKLGSAVTNYDTDMGNQLAAKESNINSILSQFGPNGTNKAIQVSQADIDQLNSVSNGLVNANTNFYKGDYSPYIQLNKLYDNKQGAQGASDLAKAQMIAKLSGNSLAGQTAGDTLQDYVGHPELAGKLDANKFDVSSQSGLASALAAAKNQRDNAESVARQDIGNRQAILSGNVGPGQASSDYTYLFDQYNKKAPEMAAKDYLANPESTSNPQKLDAAQKLSDPAMRQNLSQDQITQLTKVLDPDFKPNDITNARIWAAANSPNAMDQMSLDEKEIEMRKNELKNLIPQQYNFLRKLQAK